MQIRTTVNDITGNTVIDQASDNFNGTADEALERGKVEAGRRRNTVCDIEVFSGDKLLKYAKTVTR